MPADRDFRKLDPAAQAEARRITVAMVKSGRTRMEAAEAVGVNRRFVGAWVGAEKAQGPAALPARSADAVRASRRR
jgi:transposase